MFSNGCSLVNFKRTLIITTHFLPHIIVSKLKLVRNSRILPDTITLYSILESVLSYVLGLNLNHLLRKIITISLLLLITVWILFIIGVLILQITLIPIEHLDIAVFGLLRAKWLIAFWNLRCRISEHIRSILICSWVVFASAENKSSWLFCLRIRSHRGNLWLGVIPLNYVRTNWWNGCIANRCRSCVPCNRMIPSFSLSHIRIVCSVISSSLLYIHVSLWG